MKKLLTATIVAITGLGVGVSEGALSLDNLNTASVVNFNSFTGAGFQPSPEAGQLDSDTWAITGMSDGALAFGGTATAGDFARGQSTGGVTTGGIYAFDVGAGNIALGVQPGGDDFTAGSFTLRLLNNTDTTITSLEIAYVVYVRNDQGRANSFNFEHSSDNVSYTSVSALDLTSPEAADGSPVWVANPRSTTIGGLSIASGIDYYLRWTGDDVSGSGSRDEFALDDISVTPVPEPAEWGLICAIGLLGVCGLHTWRERRRALRQASSVS